MGSLIDMSTDIELKIMLIIDKNDRIGRSDRRTNENANITNKSFYFIFN